MRASASQVYEFQQENHSEVYSTVVEKLSSIRVLVRRALGSEHAQWVEVDITCLYDG